MSNGKSLSLPLAFGVVIIVAILASSLTYYYAALNLPAVTTTITSSTTITSTTTATQSITMTETSTVTTTKYVTLPPSTTTVTITATHTTAPSGKVITVPRNDTVAQRLAEFRLKQYVLTAIITWLIWMKSQNTPSLIFHEDPAAALVTTITTRLASQDVSALPPLISKYSIGYTRSLITIRPPQTFSNETCAPVNIVSNAAEVANISITLEPINSSAIAAKTTSKLPVGGPSTSEGVMVVDKNILRMIGTSEISAGANVTLVRTLQVLRDNIPVVMNVKFGSIMHEASINASNGALIIKMSGSTIKVIKGVEPALKEILKSLNITVTYDGNDRIAGNVIAPKYRVFMTGNVRVKVENVTFAIKLNYSGLAYLIGSNVLVFTMNSIDSLQVSVAVGGNTYCRYLKEPVVTHARVTAVSVR